MIETSQPEKTPVAVEQALVNVGFKSYEAKVYLVLLKYAGIELDIPSIHEASGIPPTRIYGILNDLAKAKLITRTNRKPLKYRAVEYEGALKSLSERRLEDLRERLSNAKTSISDYLKAHKALGTGQEFPVAIDGVWGYDQMYNTLVKTVDKAVKSISIISVGERIPDSLKKSFSDAKARHVMVKFIATKCDTSNIETLREFERELGFSVRVLKKEWRSRISPDFSYIVQDKRTVVLNIRKAGDELARYTMFAQIEGLTTLLRLVFNYLWKQQTESVEESI